MTMSARDLIKREADLLPADEADKWAAAMRLSDRDDGIFLRHQDLLESLADLAEFYRGKIYAKTDEVLTVQKLIDLLQGSEHKNIPVHFGIEEEQVKEGYTIRDGGEDEAFVLNPLSGAD